MSLIQDTISVWWKELREMSHDVGVLIFFLFLPIGYPLIYYYVYSTETARDIPVAVVDEDHSALSREFIRKLDASPEAHVYARCADMTEAQDLMRKTEVYGIIRIPSSFLDDIRHGRQTRIAAYSDVSSLIYYKSILLPCTNISQDMNKNIKIEDLGATGLSSREIDIARSPIKYDHVMLYNPQGGYASFLIPPILMLILQQAMVLGIGMAMGRTREKNGGFAIYRGVQGYDNPMAVILGKVLVIFPLFLFMALYMYVAIIFGFDLPHIGNYWSWIAMMIPYLLACSCFTIVCSCMIYRREDSLLIFVFMSVPLLFLSGISWPSVSIPHVWKVISWLFPSTFGLNAHVKIMSMGGDITTAAHEIRCLWLQAVAYFIIACVVQRAQIAYAEKHGVHSSALDRMKAPADDPTTATSPTPESSNPATL